MPRFSDLGGVAPCKNARDIESVNRFLTILKQVIHDQIPTDDFSVPLRSKKYPEFLDDYQYWNSVYAVWRLNSETRRHRDELNRMETLLYEIQDGLFELRREMLAADGGNWLDGVNL